ncbi:Predicted arabinose efflux permease, MFS family [Nocardioides exalbidus]|uniref:Predicted arabinose efflux permease, MFS family n=1 Tax=Nocardioides exalbidus TaxID=402596 RepID=A0A1H4MC53_9ACTN|nr:MFS transporter [Nocardioides exalbidus]SEB79932.1 Predicted arabinose efflux permease, MFS family [Nocardioides exalbidus]
MTSGSAADFRFRDIALVAYGPSVVSAIGHGAIMPVLALRARDLGADISVAAAIVALVGVGQLLASLPSGALIARIGERRALVAAGFVDACAMAFAALTDSVLGLAAGVLLSGVCWTLFLIARQGFMIDVVPETHRARAMSLLGGSYRVGVLVGPLIGAGLIHVTSITSVFWLGAVMSVTASLLAGTMPDLGEEKRAVAKASGHLGVWTVIRSHRRVLATVGSAVVILGMSRSLRLSLLPLWADHLGLSASTTSLIFAGAAAIDVAFMWPGGWLMDVRGRMYVAVPVVLSMALACLLLPLATNVVTVSLVMAMIACGNGLGSGIVMTLGADSAPLDGRPQFLGAWRLCGDIGNSGGPLLVSAVAAVAPLATACLVLGALILAGTGWVGYWTRRVDVARAAEMSGV